MVQKAMSPKKEQNQKTKKNNVMKRTSKGRQKIEIKYIENDAARQVTLSKRRKGLFNKSAEFSILTGAEIAIITRTDSGKISAFGYPDVYSVLDRYLNGSHSVPPRPINAEMLDEDRRLSSELEAEKRKLEEAQKNANAMNQNSYWWCEPMDNLGLGELEQCLSSLIELRANLIAISAEQNSISPAPACDTQSMGVADNVKMEQTIKTADLDLFELHNQNLSKVEMDLQTETTNSDGMDLLEYYESMDNVDLDLTINVDDLFEGSQAQKDPNNVNFTALINDCVEDDTVESLLGLDFCFSPEDYQSFCTDPCG